MPGPGVHYNRRKKRLEYPHEASLPHLKRMPPARGQQNTYAPRQQHLPSSTTTALTSAGVPAPSSARSTTRTVSPPTRTSGPTSLAKTYLLELADLISPGPTAKELAAAAHRLGVKPQGDIAQLATDVFGPATGKIASGVEHQAEQAVGRVAQAAALPTAAPQLLGAKPKQLAGHKVLGTPTTAQLLKANRNQQLQLNQRGKVTIPVTRQAARGLAKARKAVQPTGITGVSYGPEATRFANALAKYTRLDPRAMGAWVQTEGGGYAAGGEAGRNNWLGVGYPGEPTPFGRSSHFSGSPEKAAEATAQWMKGVIGGEYGYSASPGIQQIIPKAAGKGPRAFLAALQQSGWGTNVGDVARNLGAIGVQPPNPQALARLERAKATAAQLGISTKPSQGALVSQQQPAWMLQGGPKNVKHAVQVLGPDPLKQWLRPAGGNTGNWPNIADLNPVFAAQLVKLAKASGEPILVTSGYRSKQEQAETEGSPKATPGYSSHQFGMAADTEMSARQEALAPQFGLEHGAAGGQPDPPHTELTDTKLIRKAMQFGPIRSGYAPAGWQSVGDLGSFTAPANIGEGGAGGGAVPAGGTASATPSAGGAAPAGGSAGEGQQQRESAPLSLVSLLTPGAAGPPLPDAYRRFQLGESLEPEGQRRGGIIGSILRRKRL
jgi:hypothetical protein